MSQKKAIATETIASSVSSIYLCMYNKRRFRKHDQATTRFFFMYCSILPVIVPVMLNLTALSSLAGSKAVFEEISIFAADVRKGAPTALELAEQVI